MPEVPTEWGYRTVMPRRMQNGFVGAENLSLETREYGILGHRWAPRCFAKPSTLTPTGISSSWCYGRLSDRPSIRTASGTGVPVVLYDNDHPKGHHRHRGRVEQPYPFTTVARLLRDFLRDVRRVKAATKNRRTHDEGTD